MEGSIHFWHEFVYNANRKKGGKDFKALFCGSEIWGLSKTCVNLGDEIVLLSHVESEVTGRWGNVTELSQQQILV